MLRRKKGMALKLYQLIKYKIKNILWKNDAENLHQRLVPGSFLIWVNNPKQALYSRNSFKNKTF